MNIELGAAKTGPFDNVESDETTEILERPSGGQSIAFCSGRRHGQKEKQVSSVIVNRILEQIARGFRDSAAIKTITEAAYQKHNGNITGDFCMISVDFESETIVVSRCTAYPVFYYQRGVLKCWNTVAEVIGSGKNIHPSITEIPIEPDTVVIFLSEGILNAGLMTGNESDFFDLICDVIENNTMMPADDLANMFLEYAVRLDENKPHDDMTAVVLKVRSDSSSNIRSILMKCPVPEYRSIFD